MSSEEDVFGPPVIMKSMNGRDRGDQCVGLGFTINSRCFPACGGCRDLTNIILDL